MKILYISPRYKGGIGGHAFRVSEKLHQHGFNVKLMHIPHIPIKKLKNPSFVIFGKIIAFTDRETYDVVHAWNIPSALVMKNVKAHKKILSVHGIYSEQIGLLHNKTTGKLAKSLEEKSFQWANKLTTDSKSVQKFYKKKFGVDFIYLPAPIDTKKFEKIPDVKKIENQVAYVGRDSYEKGIDILKKIEPQIDGKVVYCTNMPWKETMKILKSSKILVVPSRMESIPQVIKEAFYLKIPVIATDVGGISEIITNKETGILLPSEKPNKLLGAINNLLNDDEMIEKITKNAYRFLIDNFTWDSLLPKYLKLYQQ